MRNEIWKEYPLDFGFEHQRRIFVSNFGRVKSVSQLSPDGKIISGSLQEGYPIIRIKLFKPRTAKVQEKIDAYNLEVSLIQEQIRDLKKEDILLADKMEEIEKLDNERKSVISKRSSYIRNTDKKRTFHFHFLIHRAVAELFWSRKRVKNRSFILILIRKIITFRIWNGRRKRRYTIDFRNILQTELISLTES